MPHARPRRSHRAPRPGPSATQGLASDERDRGRPGSSDHCSQRAIVVTHEPAGSPGVDAHLAALTSGQWSQLERIVERFEDAWRRGKAPALAEFVRLEAAPHAALVELAATDL